ncbi:MAG: MerR family transcriptional regulator [Actinomycetes bacterium]
MPSSRLVSTGDLARALGLSVRTIQRYRNERLITPEVVTKGKHARWDVERVKAELRELAEQDRDDA